MRRKIVTTILISILIILTVFMEVGAVAVNQAVPKVNTLEASNNSTGNEIRKETINETVDKVQNIVEAEEDAISPQMEEEVIVEEEEENEVALVNEDETEGLEEEKVSEDTEKEQIEEEEQYITEEDLIYSNKYLVKENNILKIEPKTSIEEFNKNIEIAKGKEINIYKGKEEVTSGYIGTGMIVKGDEGEEYTISVIGDINGDGLVNQVELTRMIRHIVELKEWKLEGIEKQSADITGDGEVNLVDISKLINYIVYGTWNYEGVKEPELLEAPEAPIIEVISEKEENTDYYIEKVEIKIETEQYKEGGRTIYKITGDKGQEETEIKEGEIITIEGEGEYLITAYSYGKEGNRSRVANRRITIKDKYTVIYNPGEEGLFSEQKTEGIKYGEETPEFEGNIKGTPGYMFIGWEPEVEEKVTKSVTYTAQWKKVEYTIDFGTNGGNFTMPTEGNATISTEITETDIEGNDKYTLEYVWSKDGEKAPEEGWEEFTNGDEIKKEDITEPGTWYVWVKVTDEDGNVVEMISSDPFIITGNDDEANQIKLTPNKTDWTNEDVTITVKYGENLIANKNITCTGEEGTDYEVDKDGSIIIKTNGTIITVEAEDQVGNRIVKTLTIENIDKLKPTVSLSPNGGANYVITSTGNGKINTILTAEDPEETEENGQSGLKTLQYAWSQSNTEEPENWIEFTNGEKVEKADIAEPGTWYLWTKVIDNAGNRAEEIKVSDPFIIGSSEDEANRITLIPDITTWTNQDVTVEINYGENLSENKTITCTGEEGTDYEIIGDNKIIIKTNGSKITVEAEDEAGNKIEATLVVANIDKTAPTISTLLSAPSKTTSSIDLSIGVTDSLSGLSTIEWYYKLSTASEYTKITDTYTQMNGETAGTTTAVTKTKSITGLKTGIYNIYAVVYDVVGNSTTSSTINVATTTVPAGNGNITFSYSNTNWTNQDVNVTITKASTVSNYTLQYSTDNSTWTNYSSAVEMSENGSIYARLVDSTGNVGAVATGTVANIDKTGPTISTALQATGRTESTIDLSIEVTDSLSGISSITWFCQLHTATSGGGYRDTYTPTNGEVAGTTTATTKTRTITGLTAGTTYELFVIVNDVAGNSILGKPSITVTTTLFPSYDEVAKDANGLLTANATYTSDGKTASVPKGFKIVEGIDGTKSIEDGLVIQDIDGNEFVWIPVEVTEGDTETSIASFYRSAWENNARTTGLNTIYTEPYANGYAEEAEEYAEMVKSVYENGGFYIGRYEAGSTTERTNVANGTTTMVVKKGYYPYNYVGWGSSMSDYTSDVVYKDLNQGKGAVYLSKNMYEGKEVGITSTLCYGVQWDAMLDFIKDTNNVTNSTSWGNYKDKGGVIAKTGSSDDYSAKNIYDVAGNLYEWTMEAISSTSRVNRGGFYNYSTGQAFLRSNYYPYGCLVSAGFRVALYIK